MDNIALRKMATNCATTWHMFGGVWSANNFHKCKKRNQNSFVKTKFKKTSDFLAPIPIDELSSYKLLKLKQMW